MSVLCQIVKTVHVSFFKMTSFQQTLFPICLYFWPAILCKDAMHIIRMLNEEECKDSSILI